MHFSKNVLQRLRVTEKKLNELYSRMYAASIKKWACFFFLVAIFSQSGVSEMERTVLYNIATWCKYLSCNVLYYYILYDSSCSGLVSFLPSFFCVSSSLTKKKKFKSNKNIEVEEKAQKSENGSKKRLLLIDIIKNVMYVSFILFEEQKKRETRMMRKEEGNEGWKFFSGSDIGAFLGTSLK